jgi:DNA polymerase III alpha subunit
MKSIPIAAVLGIMCFTTSRTLDRLSGRADVLRRAFNKQNHPMIEKIRVEFFASARLRGHCLEKIAGVWGLVTGFAGYAFCKAHSTAYGVSYSMRATT